MFLSRCYEGVQDENKVSINGFFTAEDAENSFFLHNGTKQN